MLLVSERVKVEAALSVLFSSYHDHLLDAELRYVCIYVQSSRTWIRID